MTLASLSWCFRTSASRDPTAIRDAEGMFHDDEGEPHEWREAGGRPRRIAGVGREDEVSQERAVRETREGWLVGRGSTRIGIYFTSVLYICTYLASLVVVVGFSWIVSRRGGTRT
jgi:hypothetical protein